jgi:phosphohistidine swiveling domain-containing protein
MTRSEFKKYLSKPWFKQEGNAHSLFIQSTAISGFFLEKGACYSGFYFWHKNGQTEMNYSELDLDRIWKIILRKCQLNIDWLKNQGKLYTKKFNEFSYEIKNQEKIKYRELSDPALLSMFKKAIWAQCFSGGLGHYCEAIGTRVGGVLENELAKTNSIKIENNILQQLLSPVSESFVSKEEKELCKIAKLPKQAQMIALLRHRDKYFWINNSYLGQGRADLNFFLKKLKSLKKNKEQAVRTKKSVKNLKLSKRTKILIKISEITSAWQDQRKENILKAVGFLDKVSREIARRTNISFKEIVNLTPAEVLAANDISDIKKNAHSLRERIQGAYYFLTSIKSDSVVSGKQAKYFRNLETKFHSVTNISSIHGQTAQPGYVKGRAVVCRYVFEMKKVRSKDILITSMTRPELMPIINRVAAIVTDEGGITCHAAIISRELKIPCVIGTKIATKVFKDGDLVEVDAERGIVRLLKKAK